MDGMSPADYRAVMGNNCNDGWFGGGSFMGIIVLFFIFAMFGGGFGGWGGNNAAAQGALTRAEMYEGFNTAEIQRNQGDLMRGQFDIQKDVLDSRYTTQLGFQQLQAQQAECCCELKTAIHAEGEATRALITQGTIQELRDNLQAAQLQLGNLSQTQTLLNAINPIPKPAYPVANPCGCGGGWYGWGNGIQ